MSKLAALDAPSIPPSVLAKPGEAHKRFALAEFLSDWHLVAFLGTTQLFSVVSTFYLLVSHSLISDRRT
jgi:nuclear protein localization protein 4 homolog